MAFLTVIHPFAVSFMADGAAQIPVMLVMGIDIRIFRLGAVDLFLIVAVTGLTLGQRLS